MRLLHTKDLTLKEFVGRWPDYAILSHTWEDDEVLFTDIANLEHARTKAGFNKVQQACRTAANDGFQWIWIDTCCIDKSSSAELSEALNSMFQWYENSVVCYAYISDMLPDENLSHGLKKSRWVTRGWTLQELIAPSTIRFFDRDWCKREGDGDICDITQIDPSVIYGRRPLASVPVCHRMAWAAPRVTTRTEDRAYSLLGIFGVNMPMLYGEGDRAFVRLQHEIIKSTNDLSIFAWVPRDRPLSRAPRPGQQLYDGIGLLAPGPESFTYSSPVKRIFGFDLDGEFSVTNNGIKITNRLKFYEDRNGYTTLSSQLQPPPSEQVYIVAEPGPIRAQGAREAAFVFKFGEAESFKLDIIEAQPSTHYDQAHRLFFTLGRPGFVGKLRLQQLRDYPNNELISIICGLNNVSQPWCMIGKGADVLLDGSSILAAHMPRQYLDREGVRGTIGSRIELRARDHKWPDIEISVSLDAETFPAFGGEAAARVHAVQVRVATVQPLSSRSEVLHNGGTWGETDRTDVTYPRFDIPTDSQSDS
ncbi:HET-domain-containing protein [Apiospora rasikravindrae]|uniref:HET-domain-containing protein n=1 Tax=Apiospora rasikravindrae TaxID=990691 RepID=A0ABR1SGM1_9PEZI